MKKYTLGPWMFLKTLNHPDNPQTEMVSIIKTKRFTFDIGNLKVIPEDEIIANAKLIAAAPELLEALEKAILRIEYMELYTEGKIDPWGPIENFKNLIKKINE